MTVADDDERRGVRVGAWDDAWATGMVEGMRAAVRIVEALQRDGQWTPAQAVALRQAGFLIDSERARRFRDRGLE